MRYISSFTIFSLESFSSLKIFFEKSFFHKGLSSFEMLYLIGKYLYIKVFLHENLFFIYKIFSSL